MLQDNKEAKCKNIFLVLISIIAVFLYGCAASDLPPEPKNLGAPIGRAAAIYEGYGVPYDVFNDNAPIFYLSDTVFNVAQEKDIFSVDLKAFQEGGYIYKYGYYYTNGGWKRYEFQENSVIGSNWIKDKGSATLLIYTNDIAPGENYIVAYSCKKYDNQWKCGCSSKDGPCNQWMLQAYLFRNVELPPEPPPPGSIIDTHVWVSPSGSLYRKNTEVFLSAYIDSQRDLSSQFKEPLFLVNKPDGTPDSVKPDYQSENYCYVCKGDYCESQQTCYISFSGKYTPTQDGIYKIDISPKLESAETQGGEFTVNDQIFSEYLIEEGIGNYKFIDSYGNVYGNDSYFSADYSKGIEYPAITYASVSVQSNKYVIADFKREIRTNSKWEKLDFNNNIIYKLSYEYDYYKDYNYKSEEYIWLSNGKAVTVRISGNDISDSSAVVEAYLKKHPSDNTVVEPEHYPDVLIEQNIGDYSYIRSVSNVEDSYRFEPYLIIYTALYQDTSKNEYMAMVFPLLNSTLKDALLKEISSAKLEIQEIDGQKVYVSSQYNNFYLWLSGDNLIYVIYDLYRILTQQMTTVSEVAYASEDAMTKSAEGISIKPEYKILPPLDIVKAYLKKYPSNLICTDSDGGVDYYVKGNATACPSEDTSKCITILDLCPGGNLLAEAYCDNADVKWSNYDCPNGCKDGACTDLIVEGDAWKVGTSTKKLELSEDLNTGGTNREILRNITTFIDKNNLKALASGTVTNSKTTSPYNQYLYLLGPESDRALDSGYVVYTEEDNDITADFLYFKSGREIGRYLLEFTTALESDVDDALGSASTTGLFLTDYQDVDITMFGKKYTIVTAKRTSTLGNGIILTLMGGAVKDTLLEKQTKTYTIRGKDYEVTLNFVDADEAQFVINGQTTRKMKDGDTDKLADGTTVGVTDVLYQDYAGGIHSATFYLGVDKIELNDTNVRDSASSSSLKANDKDIDDAYVIIEGSDNNFTFKINRIHVNMTADDGFYVPAGGKLSETIKAEGGTTAEPEVLFTQNWDIKYESLKQEMTENIEIVPEGTNKYNLKFKDGDGNQVSVPIAETSGDNQLYFGSSRNSFINKENLIIKKDDYVVFTDSSKKRGDRKTYVLQYKGADKVTADNPIIKFRNLASGAIIEQIYANKTPLAFLKLGGIEFGVYKAPNANVAENDFSVQIDLDADGILESTGEYMLITTMFGAEINLTNESANRISFAYRIPDNDRDVDAKDNVESLQATPVRMNISAASGQVSLVNDITADKRLNFRAPSGKTNIFYAYDSYGSFFTYMTPTNNPATLKIEHPERQRLPSVFYIAGNK